MNESCGPAARRLPSQDRGGSWISRRDHVLLVLHEQAGLSNQEITELTAGDVTVADGTAAVRFRGDTVTLTADPNDPLCGPCTLARWLRTLDMAVAYPDQRVATAVITRGASLTPGSLHVCGGTTRISAALREQPLLPAVDQWGLIPPAATRRRLPGAATI